jgi:hypothetical protein
MAAPIIDTQPVGVAYIVGQSVTLTVAAHSSPSGHTLAYQWYKGTAALSGKTTATLTISSAALTDAGSYTVVVTDGADSVTSTAALLECDSIIAHIIRNRKTLLKTISTTNGASFTPNTVEEERLLLNINGRYPFGLLLKAPIEPNEEDNRRDEVDFAVIVCWFFNYNDDSETLDEITYKYRNVVADTVAAWMTDRTMGELMEGTRLLGSDQGVAQDSKGNLCYRVDVVFSIHGFVDSDNPYLKG